MANPMAGEVDVMLNGEVRMAKLTLGALAELEQDLKAESLLALVERFEKGLFSARDVLAVLAAGLRGGGWGGRADDLLSADIGGGPLAAARLAAALLARAFRLPE
ncbi:MAG: gene transfer agent family protein [Paracoccus sp. (in: a-proteobacteria)]|uniref:gene transfer agent family protein n=1 Tax=Paracoccus sp. TaxID=267 RepID=UPI0026DED965|nr:gene transfer agent family protein [Paracoccus sp. (in: a-proteobacteria)]MDO5613868.1 gene transfer agent family protein [Paracoccus sp. (in: a-proteobacteria)]